jgi:hypothetical protein
MALHKARALVMGEGARGRISVAEASKIVILWEV